MGNKIDKYLCKKKALLKPVSYGTLAKVSDYGMTNGSNIRVAFTPDNIPKRGKNG